MDRDERISWLRETDAERLEALWLEADRVRREQVGEAVHLRGLIEFSNYCRRSCAYCGLRVQNRQVERYRMLPDEIVECAHQARRFGYGTVVLQSGEDLEVASGWMAALIRRIKEETGLAVTLSLGERRVEEFERWRLAGADRYLLRFETSNPCLFEQIHPQVGSEKSDRLALLRALRQLGYEVGSGVMVGIPGQTYEDLANDLELFRDLDLDMIGIGPFIPHPATPLALKPGEPAPADQTPNDELMTYKMVALTRLMCPRSNIPSTTALATLNKAQGRELGLMRGANIVMPNLTPPKYRVLYEIYPDKACVNETADQCQHCLRQRIEVIGRHVGVGSGISPNWEARFGKKAVEFADSRGDIE
ncbi:MAG TPA: [FeFe] hydrogenase H-cluster radical SAM maturase HydE [Candidatus Sumerlaeota bacterium]|nr:[FeFe] hydrogenase H-cluster radical SAM maturase HydE [Candidatus Sumerlaeota bacterium]HPS00492.1 [FeFe] hydrogenase H-cluster radical SAM maturase HydE [Candidatus Sumerlaeota bacterium]